MGFAITGGLNEDAFILKTSPEGELEWMTTARAPEGGTLGNALICTPEGGFIAVGQGYEQGQAEVFIMRTDTVGQLMWQRTYGTPAEEAGTSIVRVHAVGYAVTGYAETAGGTAPVLLLIEDEGEEVSFDILDNLGESGEGFVALRNAEDEAAGVVLAGRLVPHGAADAQVFLAGLGFDATLQWLYTYGEVWGEDKAAKGLYLTGEGYVLAGTATRRGGHTDQLLLKTGLDGRVHTNRLFGKVLPDEGACTFDVEQTGLPQFLVEAVQGEESYLALTDEQGRYSLDLPAGTYRIRAHPVSDYWELCTPEQRLELGEGESAELNFAVRPIVQCPLLEVSVSTPFLRRCFEATYTVQYANYGTVPATQTRVELLLDEDLEYRSATQKPILVDGPRVLFHVGTVQPQERGSFQVQVGVGCEETVLGQTHCVEARIFPDSFCLATQNWSGANIEVGATCLGDSIEFVILNTGTGPTSGPLNYIVIEDQVVLLQGTFTLDAGETLKFTLPANGSTYFFQAQQEPGNPNAEDPSVTVEGCGAADNITLGLVNAYPLGDGNPFLDIDCQPNIGSFDPNDKQGYPLGYGDRHYIRRGQDLEYHIRFQNTGTDTAFRVVVEDVLPPQLDPRTLRPGAASHPYRVEFRRRDGANALRFVFDDILLPDSSTNEPASHGFVRFKISQRPELPPETTLENRADIFFDFNRPVRTNTARHTLGEDFFPKNLIELDRKGVLQLDIRPNPVVDRAWLLMPFSNAGETLEFRLYDLSGRPLHRETFTGGALEIRPRTWNLRSGLYFFEVLDGKRRIGMGRFVAL